MCHFAYAACPRAPRPLRIETIAQREFGIIGSGNAIDQRKIVQRIYKVKVLSKGREGRYPVLEYLWHIAIGDLRLDHMDESLSGHETVITSPEGWPIQDSDQIRDLPRDRAWPSGAVVVDRLVHATSHGQS